MKINDLPTDAILAIQNFLRNSTNFVNSTKTFAELSRRLGHAKKIDFDSSTTLREYVERVSRHKRTLEELTIRNEEEAHLYVMYWPKVVNFVRCSRLPTDFMQPPNTIVNVVE
jgi:hypothetical protein